MGLCNAPQTFQTLMNNVFHDCIDNFIVIYLDDLLIFSSTMEEHLEYLKKVVLRLKEKCLYASTKKCSCLQEEVEFLGLRVGRDGIHIGRGRVEAIEEWRKPTSATERRSFIGLAQFFRRFVKGFSQIAAPLTDLTRKGSGIHHCNADCDSAFARLKKALTTAPVLIAPDWEKPFCCHTDASQTAVGGTLTQSDKSGNERVVAYFSKRLSPQEENYSANDRELLALVYLLKRFRCYLEGSTFDIITDNQVLYNIFTKKDVSRREARWLDFFASFGINEIKHRAGRIHICGTTTNALSCRPTVFSGEQLRSR